MIDNNMLDAVGDDFERAVVIAKRAQVDPRTGGSKLKALEREGLVVSKWTQKYGGVWLYKRSELAPAVDILLVSVRPEFKNYSIRIGQNDVVGLSGGTWNSNDSNAQFTSGVLLNVPDAKALRAIIRELNRALIQIEAGS